MSRTGALFTSAPYPPILHSTVVWLEERVRQPLEGTIFDVYFALPAKRAYLAFIDCQRARQERRHLKRE